MWRRFATRGAFATAGVAGAAYAVSPGFRRSVCFWSTVAPFVGEYQSIRLRARWERWEPSELEAAQQHFHHRSALRAVDVILRLGGIYIKIGQFASTMGAGVLEDAYIQALRPLQDGVPPRSLTEVRRIIEADIGVPMEELFSSFDPEPVGAASIAQARLRANVRRALSKRHSLTRFVPGAPRDAARRARGDCQGAVPRGAHAVRGRLRQPRDRDAFPVPREPAPHRGAAQAAPGGARLPARGAQPGRGAGQLVCARLRALARPPPLAARRAPLLAPRPRDGAPPRHQLGGRHRPRGGRHRRRPRPRVRRRDAQAADAADGQALGAGRRRREHGGEQTPGASVNRRALRARGRRHPPPLPRRGGGAPRPPRRGDAAARALRRRVDLQRARALHGVRRFGRVRAAPPRPARAEARP
mmetsp:Transcript_1490/g.4730  ORF Transcript_1490/g.4730 Transcript_1490/m.4730 type:complete len:415 (-) Transcript_1490:422-1666(-)